MHEMALFEATARGLGSIASPLNLPLPPSVAWTIYLVSLAVCSLAIWIAGGVDDRPTPEVEPPGDLAEAA